MRKKFLNGTILERDLSLSNYDLSKRYTNDDVLQMILSIQTTILRFIKTIKIRYERIFNMEEINKMINEINNIETKNIVIETKEFLTPEERMAIDTIRRVKNPFRMISVKDVMNDLNVCETIAYRIFKRNDFPSINIGKSKQIMLLSYLIWKMKKRV